MLAHDRLGTMPRRRATSASVIYDTLLAEIISLDMPPGTSLAEKALLERFGVSRTPVREALLRLSEVGLVDIFPQSGTFVSRIAVNAIPEAVLVRKALEGVTVKAASASTSPDRARRLDATIGRQMLMSQLGDINGFHQADEDFHAEIAEIAGYPGIWRLLIQVKLQIDRARRLTLPAINRMEHVIGEHRAIRAAIVAGEASVAHAAMDAHLGAVIPDVDALRLSYPGYFS
ncbi:MAG: GntR family transcriptional regulator [Rhizobiaceae bacterium]|nr:GntR family transcriptional regulator [Rhizobiaceae bacterium]